MAKGWAGANGADQVFPDDAAQCEMCGIVGDIRIFHHIIPPIDHRLVCKGCGDLLPESEWYGCGCGG